MPRSLKLYVAVVAVSSVVALVAATVLFPVSSAIAVRGPDATGQVPSVLETWAGIAFWTAFVLLASSLPIQMRRGAFVAVSIAPVVAAMSLGGPAVAGWVAALGTTELRELRGRIPWYATLTNHGGIVLPAIAGGIVATWIGHSSVGADFVGVLLGATTNAVLNIAIASLALSLRRGEDFRRVFEGEIRELAGGQIALAPVAWLMAQVYLHVAWWGALLFAVPLWTTRLSYKRVMELRDMFTQTVSSLAQAVDARDKYTSGHSIRVKEIAVDIGRVLRCNDAEMEALEWGGLLHDVGKIGVPDAVLLKQERLTREERMIMNSHPVLGAEIIAPVTKLAPELPLIRHHHEWYNGSGYPDRLIGDEIPRLARILHVADAFEAMTAARPYRMKPLSAEQALGELRKYAGVQFDPVVVDAFVKTSWVEGTVDPGRTLPPRPVPLISQAAGRTAQPPPGPAASDTPPDLG